MQETSTSPGTILQFRQDIEAEFRRHIREAFDTALAEELAAALGSAPHQRTDRRRGYRNGRIERTITTREGTRRVTVPRGRIADGDGRTREFHSQLLRAMPGGRARSTTPSSAAISAASIAVAFVRR